MRPINKYSYEMLKVGVIAVILTLMSCERSYPGLEYDNGKDDIANNEASNKTPIQLYVNEPSIFSVSTKGLGSIDNQDPNWQKKRQNMLLHIFAFNNNGGNMKENMSTAHNGDIDNLNCLVDNGVSSGDDYYKGKPASLVDDEGLEFISDIDTKETEHLYYSSKHQEQGYDFFAYHIDDFIPNSANTHRGEDVIYHDIEIDGSQDIMCGYAPKLSLYMVMYALGYASDKPVIGDAKQEQIAKDLYNMMSDVQKNDVNNMLNNGYSTYSAHRGVNPVINIKHQLARLRFEAYPGDNTAENITIQKIEVVTKTKGRLTVAAHDMSKIGMTFDESQKEKSVFLREASEDGKTMQELRQDYYKVKMTEEDKHKGNWSERTRMPIGDCLLVKPEETIHLILHYDEIRKVEFENTDKSEYHTFKDLTVEYHISPPDKAANKDETSGTLKFKPGNSYNIKIAVYGLQPIKVMADMEAWGVGGDVNLGEDEFHDGVTH